MEGRGGGEAPAAASPGHAGGASRYGSQPDTHAEVGRRRVCVRSRVGCLAGYALGSAMPCARAAEVKLTGPMKLIFLTAVSTSQTTDFFHRLEVYQNNFEKSFFVFW
jgi:hypothetical protein